jgi:hypothetical protein
LFYLKISLDKFNCAAVGNTVHSFLISYTRGKYQH